MSQVGLEPTSTRIKSPLHYQLCDWLPETDCDTADSMVGMAGIEPAKMSRSQSGRPSRWPTSRC